MNLLLVVSTYLFVGVMVNAQALPIASASNGTVLSAEKELISLARARANAFASGNCKALTQYYPRDFRIIEAGAAESRDSLLQECENNKILPGHSQRRIVSDFHFRLLGDVALLDYQYETIDCYGRVSFTNIDRQVDTYQKRNGTWDLVLVVIPESIAIRRWSKRMHPRMGTSSVNMGGWVRPVWWTRSRNVVASCTYKPPAEVRQSCCRLVRTPSSFMVAWTVTRSCAIRQGGS